MLRIEDLILKQQKPNKQTKAKGVFFNSLPFFNFFFDKYFTIIFFVLFCSWHGLVFFIIYKSIYLLNLH